MLKAKKSLKIFRELLSGKFPLLPISSRMQGKSENVSVLEKNVNSFHNYFPYYNWQAVSSKFVLNPFMTEVDII